MTPPTAGEIDQALDLLDWIPLPAILEMRYHLTRLIRTAREVKRLTPVTDRPWATMGPRHQPDPVALDEMQRALLYVLWTTSDEYLEQQMREAPPAVH